MFSRPQAPGGAPNNSASLLRHLPVYQVQVTNFESDSWHRSVSGYDETVGRGISQVSNASPCQKEKANSSERQQ